MKFDFENAKPWEVSTSTLLPVGDHVVTLRGATSNSTRNRNPQIELEGYNDHGSRKDWVVYAEENGVRKVVALFQAAGVPLSNEDQDEDGRLTQEAVDRLNGKRVLMVVREETYQGKTNPRVKGYLPATESDIPADTTGLPEANSGNDLDIPF